MAETFKKWGYRALPASGLTPGAEPMIFNGIDAEGKIFDVPSETGALPAGWGEPESVGSAAKTRAPVETLPRAEQPAPDTEQPTPQQDGPSIDELRAEAEALGLTVNQYWKKAKLISLINAAKAVE